MEQGQDSPDFCPPPPLSGCHPHPVSILQGGDQWSVPMPFKEGSGSPSGSGRLYFQIFFHLHSGITLRFLPRGRGLAIKLLLWDKHYTASVYWGHGNLSWPTPFLWDQPARLTDGWLFKPYIGRVSQTSKTKVIGSLHIPRMRGKRGEVII